VELEQINIRADAPRHVCNRYRHDIVCTGSGGCAF